LRERLEGGDFSEHWDIEVSVWFDETFSQFPYYDSISGTWTNLSSINSSIFDCSLYLSHSPDFSLCNSFTGLVSDDCVSKDASIWATNLSTPISFTVPLSFYSSDPSSLVCMYFDEEMESWRSDGCEAVNVTNTSVTCECSHFTAFAVSTLVKDENSAASDCSDLSSEWSDIYNHEGYHSFVGLMAVSWFVVLCVAIWWYFKQTKKALKRLSITNFVIANVVPMSLLRMFYFAALGSAWTSSSNIACMEFNLEDKGSDFPISPLALLIVHDSFYPFFLLAFSAINLYWFDLQQAISFSLGLAKRLTFLQTKTLIGFILGNMVVLVLALAADTVILLSPSSSSVAVDMARSYLVIVAAVFGVESIFFFYFGVGLVNSAGRKPSPSLASSDELAKQKSASMPSSSPSSTMTKVKRTYVVSSLGFGVLSLTLITLSIPYVLSTAISALLTYSVFLHLIEVLLVGFITVSMTKASKIASKLLHDSVWYKRIQSSWSERAKSTHATESHNSPEGSSSSSSSHTTTPPPVCPVASPSNISLARILSFVCSGASSPTQLEDFAIVTSHFDLDQSENFSSEEFSFEDIHMGGGGLDLTHSPPEREMIMMMDSDDPEIVLSEEEKKMRESYLPTYGEALGDIKEEGNDDEEDDEMGLIETPVPSFLLGSSFRNLISPPKKENKVGRKEEEEEMKGLDELPTYDDATLSSKPLPPLPSSSSSSSSSSPQWVYKRKPQTLREIERLPSQERVEAKKEYVVDMHEGSLAAYKRKMMASLRLSRR